MQVLPDGPPAPGSRRRTTPGSLEPFQWAKLPEWYSTGPRLRYEITVYFDTELVSERITGPVDHAVTHPLGREQRCGLLHSIREIENRRPEPTVSTAQGHRVVAMGTADIQHGARSRRHGHGPSRHRSHPTLVEIPPLTVEHIGHAHRSAGAHEFLGLLHPIPLKELQLKLVGEGVLALTDKPFRETGVRA